MEVGWLLFVGSWSAGGPCDVMLGVFPAWDGVFGGVCVGEWVYWDVFGG